MLRHATDADRDTVLRWRNHPEVRRVSLTQHVITEGEHAAWWDRSMADASRLLLIYERAGEPRGVVTFFDLDLNKRSAWWGYYLDNDGLEKSGQLMPAWISIQREAVTYARDVLALRQLDGETLASNEAVVNFNSRMGFEAVEREMRNLSGRVIEVLHTRKTWVEE